MAYGVRGVRSVRGHLLAAAAIYSLLAATMPSSRRRGLRRSAAPPTVAFIFGLRTFRSLLSCTPDLATAARFATSRSSLLFLITARSFMQRGASLRFLSCFPSESEYAYPPCTYLRPTGRWQRVELSDMSQCVVMEVTPQFGS